MATFKTRANGRVQAVIRRKGKKPLSETFDTEALAKGWADKTEAQLLAGTYKDLSAAKGMMVTALVDWFEKTVVPGYKSKATYISWNKRIKARFPHQTVLSLTSDDIVEWAKELKVEGLAPATIKRGIWNLTDAYKSGMTFKLFYVPEIPTENALERLQKLKIVGKNKKRDRRLRQGEFEAFMAVKHKNPTQIKQAFEFAIECPMRESEIAAMRTDRLDRFERIEDGRVVTYGIYHLDHSKTDHMTGQQGRVAPISPRGMEIIDALPKRKDGKVWAFKTGNSIGQAYRRTCKLAGIEDLTFHDLRHEGTSRYADMGYHGKRLMAFTGHKSEQSVARYTHPDPVQIARSLN